MAQSKLRGHLDMTCALAFVMSFCSLAYQVSIALALTDATGDFVSSQAFSLAAFLLGMGVGAWRAESRGSGAASLFRIELSLALIGAAGVGYVRFSEILAEGFWPATGSTPLFALTLPYVAGIGFLTGFEIPRLLEWRPSARAGHVLGWSYFGALLATALVPTVFLPALDVHGTAHLVAVANFVMAAALAFLYGGEWRRPLVPRLALVVGASALLAWLTFEPGLRSFHLKTVYVRPRFSSLSDLVRELRIYARVEAPRRLRTQYQWIDLVHPAVSEDLQGSQDFFLFLDRKSQFGSEKSARYHQSMVHGAVNLLGQEPKRVLVLGGGDGVLLPELLSYSAVKRIDLVEIDPRMLEIAASDPNILRLNRGKLADPRVHVHVGDAFQFLRSSAGGYDLILADLPFPTNYDLSLLFTKEFYALARARLSPPGVLILDSPLPQNARTAFQVTIRSLLAAGFRHPFSFGSMDVFTAAARDDRPLAFEYPSLLARVENGVLINLLSREDDLRAAKASEFRPNSVFFPYSFLPGKGEGP